MTKTILITGATDGIGLATTRMLLSQGHKVLLHGRNPKKLATVAASLSDYADNIELFEADLSRLAEVSNLAGQIGQKHRTLDVLINNAGVLKTTDTVTRDGLDARFAVNTIAPYLLTKQLLPLLGTSGRVVNVSSAAQAPVDLDGLMGRKKYADAMSAYAQSKLAIIMWTRALAAQLGENGPVIVAVNPGSLLASKMVQQGFGVAGSDLNIGAKILVRAGLSDEFSHASGKYFDNDAGRFSDPHPDALSSDKIENVMQAIEQLLP